MNGLGKNKTKTEVLELEKKTVSKYLDNMDFLLFSHLLKDKHWITEQQYKYLERYS